MNTATAAATNTPDCQPDAPLVELVGEYLSTVRELTRAHTHEEATALTEVATTLRGWIAQRLVIAGYRIELAEPVEVLPAHFWEVIPECGEWEPLVWHVYGTDMYAADLDFAANIDAELDTGWCSACGGSGIGSTGDTLSDCGSCS